MALRKNPCKIENCGKNDTTGATVRSRSNFLQYTSDTVICQDTSAISLMEWSVNHAVVPRNGIRLIAGGSAEPVGIHDLQLAQHPAPVSQRHNPLLGDLMRCQIQRLQKRCIARKYAPLLIQTTVAAVQTLDGISGVDHLSDISRELEDRRYQVPILVPALHGVGIAALPFFGNTVESFQSSFLSRRMIDRFQVVGELFLVLPADVFKRISHLMNDAALELCLRKRRIDGFFYACKSISANDQNILYATIFSSFITPSQYFALSFSPICMDRTSL